MGGRITIGDTKATVIEIEADEAADLERQANRFAAELLMPGEVCRARASEYREAYRACPRSIFAYHLAAELLVSPEAMRYRLRDLEVGDE
jgi:Zn-dependent peptidase ImmA (M78 family)